MSNTPRQPRPDDAVLGGQTPQVPMDAAVLGGIEGVKQRFATDDLTFKKLAIKEALNYGDKGIELLFELMEKERNLEVQWFTYQTLYQQNNPTLQARLEKYWPTYEFESVTVNRRGEIIKRTPGHAKYFREELGNGVYLDMVYIPRGTFLMGSPSSEKKSDWSKGTEEPQHQVTVSPFWMGKYTVTQEQWQAIMGNNPSYFKGNKRPVERVNWNEAQAFCQKLSQKTGRAYQLPSEAQWEYACRAGTTTPFHTGETITTNLANYNGTYESYAEESKGIYREETVEVGKFPPNGFGLYDMHGNVWEWCEDGWHDNYRGAPTDGSAWNDNHSQSSLRVVRGGSWYTDVRNCRSAPRSINNRVNAYNNYGFRVVCGV